MKHRTYNFNKMSEKKKTPSDMQEDLKQRFNNGLISFDEYTQKLVKLLVSERNTLLMIVLWKVVLQELGFFKSFFISFFRHSKLPKLLLLLYWFEYTGISNKTISNCNSCTETTGTVQCLQVWTPRGDDNGFNPHCWEICQESHIPKD